MLKTFRSRHFLHVIRELLSPVISCGIWMPTLPLINIIFPDNYLLARIYLIFVDQLECFQSVSSCQAFYILICLLLQTCNHNDVLYFYLLSVYFHQISFSLRLICLHGRRLPSFPLQR